MRPYLHMLLLCCLFLGFSLAACSDSPDPASLDPEALPTLTPTPDALGYQSIASRSCLVADWGTIQSTKAQGDLIAWRADTHELAYIAPSQTTTWFTGLLSLASGQDFSNRQVLAETVLAAGDLTWSPDGEQIAFLAFRVDESLETVMVLSPGGSPLDLFPLDTARTDSRTSQKAVMDWLDNNLVRVFVSCGEDCQQQIDINTQDGSTTPAGSTQRKNAGAALDREGIKAIDGLELRKNILEYDPDQFPRGFGAPDTNLYWYPNWSPDNKQVAYLDRRGLLWLLNPEDKTHWILDIGLREVDETKWSSDSKMLAIRAEDHIYIFEVNCSQ